MIGRGCKLDPKLISALIERWSLETHTFYLPCGECTITLEYVHLQLGLPVDRDAVTRSIHSADWGAVCYELLGAIPDNINGVSLSIFTSSSGPPIYIPTHNEFQWTPYEDPAIRAVIPDEYLQNLNVWYVKVPLVNFAIVGMHQSDRVLRQFRFRQPIPVAPEVLDDHHKINLR
ncbi:hypothetical protein PVK06_027996 [Gossypium arboreum]|uniref:Aminotransferase-like plant mobile domain-containing protein n=1 Tax=Gossypium arboreum TaxID=29729 RepID=A0ABR0P492_GOSAR|nr:hypothetical protein PVK06_027996 [Gossypium arboreum]